MDIKESKELLSGIELVAVEGIKAVKAPEMSEKISIALGLIKQADTIIEAVKGVDKVDEEIKDLDQAELIELGVATFNMIKKIAAEAKKSEVK